MGACPHLSGGFFLFFLDLAFGLLPCLFLDLLHALLLLLFLLPLHLNVGFLLLSDLLGLRDNLLLALSAHILRNDLPSVDSARWKFDDSLGEQSDLVGSPVAFR